MKPAIYQIRNLVNGKVYVGSALNYVQRFRSHRNGLASGRHFNTYLQNAWNKYGESNFVFEALDYLEASEYIHVELLAELLKRETLWIEEKKAYERATGYNICRIANSPIGVKRSEKTKKLMSEVKLGSKNPMFGKPVVGCFKTGLTGKKNWNFGKIGGKSQNAKAICQLDLNGNKIAEWGSQVEIVRSKNFLPLNKTYQITRCLKHQRNEAFGFKWVYA